MLVCSNPNLIVLWWDQDVWPLLSGQNKTSPRVEVPLSALPGAAMVAAPENGFRDPM